MARILGLDLGSYSVKALLVEANFRSSAVKRFAEVRLQPGDRAAAIKAALEHLAQDKGLAADQVAVNTPGLGAAVQVLTLPFNNEKQIEQTLPFEVEGQMLFDLEDIAYDYQAMAGATAQKSDLLVGAMRKDELRALLEQLQGFGVEPRVVTLPSLVYTTLLSTGLHAPSEVHAIVDLGHSRISVALGTALGGCELARSFAGGGADLTRAIGADFKVGPDEAQTWKEKYADLTERTRTGDDLAAYNALLRGLQPVVRELRQTFRANQARFRHPVQRVHLCGGTARIPGLAELLSRELGVPTQLWHPPAELTGAVAQAEVPVAAQSWALAQRAQLGPAGNKATRFNLRRGDFAFKSDFEFVKEKMGRLGAFAAVLLLLGGVQGFARLHALDAREKVLDDKLFEVTQKVLSKGQRDFTVALSMLREHNAPAASLPTVSAVELLAETANHIPSDNSAKLNEVEISLSRMRLRGTVDSYEALDKLSNALKSYKCFSAINPGKTEKDKKDPTKIDFQLDIEVGCGQTPPAQGS
ncbi:MAG: pilus assembly protein PilM [Deltaproteobacteria bacterium]|nr:pilus assembly protein PilM [Deltaproteobacteria bacterium]